MSILPTVMKRLALMLSTTLALTLAPPTARPALAQATGPRVPQAALATVSWAERGAVPGLDVRAASATGGMPHWLRWGLIGAAGGAVTFAVLGGLPAQGSGAPHHSTATWATEGAIAGFVVIGGAVAFYDWVCAAGSRSERAGLCKEGRARVGPASE
jgi:hypothetical protein